MSSGPVLSVVVAVTDAEDERGGSPAVIPLWLSALLREARSVGAELLLAGELAPSASLYERAGRDQSVPVRVLAVPRAALAPELWGLGLLAAVGDTVAFSINQCTVPEGWALAILDGLRGDAGVGGPLDLAPHTSRTGRAIYLLRYSAFLRTGADTRREVRDIAGDNAAYRRELLLQVGTYAHGFWEIEAHHGLRAAGHTLALIPGMAVTFGGSPRLGPFMRQRFAHGQHFGAWRVRGGGRRPWQIVAAAPLVPFVFLLRTARRVAGTRIGIGQLARCLGPFLSLAAAWAAGEASGALRHES